MNNRRNRVFVGCWESDGWSGKHGGDDGGIHVFDLDHEGVLVETSSVQEPGMAGFLAYARSTRTLYAIDQRISGGRGSDVPPPAVWSFDVDAATGALTFKNRRLAPGSCPSYLALDDAEQTLFCANHGWHEHVERVVKTSKGEWVSEVVYDDSSVIAYALDADGSVGAIRDLHLRTGHGPVPNSSPQADGMAQSGAHAHCVEIDPSGRWAVVCDKGTDEVVVLDVAHHLAVTSVVRMPPGTGPRHITFDPHSDRAYMTCEFSQELASLALDQETGTLRLLDCQSSRARGFDGWNEPAAVGIHPNGRVIYVNNRGEDTLVWFSVHEDGRLNREGAFSLPRVEVAPQGVRDFTLTVDGRLMLVPDWHFNVVRTYAVDPDSGAVLREVSSVPVHAPVHLLLTD